MNNILKTKINKNISKPAFSLVETLIVLFIISLGLVGILTLIVQGIQSQDYNRNTLIGYQLSQEGVELIRRERDSNWNNGLAFNAGLAELADTVYQYCFDYDDATLTTTENACPLRVNGDGFYVHEVLGPLSGFSRLIKLELVESGTAIRVLSSVYWNSRQGISSYTSETLLYDWR